MPYPLDPLDVERRARQKVEGVGWRAVGAWRNIVNHEPELAAWCGRGRPVWLRHWTSWTRW